MTTYLAGANRPAAALTLVDDDGSASDLADFDTYAVRVGPLGQAALLEKSSGLTVDANVVTVAFSVADLEGLSPAVYELDVIATGPGITRKWRGHLRIDPALGPVVEE